MLCKRQLDLLRMVVGGIVLAAATQLSSAQRGPSGQGSPASAQLRQIQQQYQKLVQDEYQLQADVYQKQAQFWQDILDQTKDLILDLIENTKSTEPDEDPGATINDYVELLQKSGEVVNWGFKTLNDIWDSKNTQADKELQLQEINQQLAQATVAVQALVDIENAIKHPTIHLQELPEPEVDFSALDQAIENMREQDQAFLEAEAEQLAGKQAQQTLGQGGANEGQVAKALADWNAKRAAWRACENRRSQCDSACESAPLPGPCMVACGYCDREAQELEEAGRKLESVNKPAPDNSKPNHP